MNSLIRISQQDGLILTFSPVPGKPDVVIASLTGSEFSAQVSIGDDPAFPGAGRMLDFFVAAAAVGPGETEYWQSLCQDLHMKAELGADGSIWLHVGMGSNSDDECDWIVNATLRV